jgi:transposase
VDPVDPRDARIAELEGQLKQALEQIRVLSLRLAQLEGRSGGGTSTPPGSTSTGAKREPTGRKPGGQPGHKGHCRELLVPTTTTDCIPTTCRSCGEALPAAKDADPLRHQVIDLPPMKPTVDEFRLHRITCACGVTTCGQPPAGTPAGLLGPRLLALVGLLVAGCHVSRRKVRALLHDVLGVDISLGALSESEEVISDAVAAPVEEARLHAVAAKVKHADGTTWYRENAFRALWVLATTRVTVFSIFESATKEVLVRWMGRKGTLVSDRGSQLTFWDMERRQICWAHLIRKFAWYSEQGGEAARFGLALLERARFLMHEWHRVRDGCITRETFRRRTAAARDAVELMLRAAGGLPVVGGSCLHILEHKDALWRFASHDGIEPTNNHAEQELRGFVLWRKTTLGSQSARGDHFAANLKSVIHTCRKQKRHVLAYLSEAIQATFNKNSAPSLLHSP